MNVLEIRVVMEEAAPMGGINLSVLVYLALKGTSVRLVRLASYFLQQLIISICDSTPASEADVSKIHF